MSLRPGSEGGSFLQSCWSSLGNSSAGLPFSWFYPLCIFAGKMLTLPNKLLCSSNLCCLTFDSPYYQWLPPLLARARAPGRALSRAGWEGGSRHSFCRQMAAVPWGRALEARDLPPPIPFELSAFK